MFVVNARLFTDFLISLDSIITHLCFACNTFLQFIKSQVVSLQDPFQLIIVQDFQEVLLREQES